MKNTPRRHLSYASRAALILLTGALPLTLQAADRSSLWTGLGDGSTWEAAANWSPDTAFPNNTTDDNFFATINHTTGTLSIATSQAITLRGLSLTQEAGGSTTLKLGGDMTLVNGLAGTQSGFFNQTGSAGGIVLDLNGHQFSLSNVTSARQDFDKGSYTLKSSAADGSGIFAVRAIGSTALLDVQDNVTVKVTVATSSYLDRATWSNSSTLHISNTGNHHGYRADSTGSAMLGNLVVGDSANTAATTFILVGNDITVQGDLTLHSYATATGGAASRLSFNTSSPILRVVGNFTDHGTDATGYSNSAGTSTGTIAFSGGSSEKTVSIGRTGLSNHFAIGTDQASSNIVLAQNLTTTGDVTLAETSRLNLAQYTLSAGNFLATEGATLAFDRNGVVDVSGTLTLGSFNLELLGDWSDWTAGNDLTLLSYNTLAGTPDIATFINTAGLQYDSLVAEDGRVYLTNVTVIPEPGVYTLVFISALVGIGLTRSRFKTAA